jgi:PAS domain S-box-containing protein
MKLNSINLKNETDKDISTLELEKYLSLIGTLKGREEFLLDENGIIISSNLESVNITGYEEFEVIGKHFSMFYMAEEKEKAFKDLVRAISLKQIIVTGLRVKKRGVTFWAKTKIRYSTDTHGRTFFKVAVQDTTHRALSNMRVQSIRDEYLAIFNNPFVGAFKFRMSDYQILMCNPKTLEITAHSNSDNLHVDSFFNSASEFEQLIALLKRDKKVEGFQFLIQNTENTDYTWGVISARYFENQDFVEGVLLDVSEQHNQMIELKRINSELDNFTYHASHDLRAPLTTIMGLVNLGEQQDTVENGRAYFEMIRNQITRLDVLLKDLISVSYNSKSEIANTPFYFDDEVKTIFKSLEYPGHPFRIEVKVLPEHVNFSTDPVRLRTILRNLLSNAFKYYNPNIRLPFIKLNVQINEHNALIQLKDNGIGIEKEYTEKIYDIFFRGTIRSSGSGLGLYIVKSMVEKLGGAISVDSTIYEGTIFTVSIPNQFKNFE